jgi:acetyl esterase/lipase
MMRSRPAASAGISVAEQRAGFETMAQPVAPDVTVNKVDANGVPAEWIAAPGADTSRAILYLHGGGYVIGSIATHREMLGRLSRAAGVRVLALDYRLAPEHPFPAAVEDAVAGYRWLLAQGIDAQSVAIGGDSAGGGLTAATLVSLRDQGIALPAAGVMLSPWTDLAGTGESLRTRAALDPIITGGGSGISSMATNYAGSCDLKTPLISPLYADLKGLPPLLIQVGTSEVLFDDSTRFDACARGAGVDVTFEAWNGMVHVWHLFAGMVPEGQEAIDRIGQFVKARTRGLAPA